MELQDVFSVIDGLNEQYCDLWERICNIESPTDYKEGIDQVGDIFIKMARERGLQVKVQEYENAGNAIAITLNPEATARPVVFSGHLDTVHPIGIFGTPAVRREKNILYGPGVMDCKGGAVASMMALDALQKCGFQTRPVKVFLQTDEETNCANSDKQTIAFMCSEAKDAVAFLNAEGIYGNTVVLVRKGILRCRFTVRGKSAHAAMCMDGASAICEAAHKIVKLETLKDKDGITCNCGVIHGGTVSNTVPEECWFEVDIRFATDEQYDAAFAFCQKVAAETAIDGCSCLLEKISDRPAMPLTDRNLALLDKINEIYGRCGLPTLTGRATTSGSDAAYTTQAGIPTVDNIGIAGGNIHSPEEFADMDSLADCVKRLVTVALYI